jgi:recombination protein RecA
VLVSQSVPDRSLSQRLAALVGAVQRRWGQRALQQGAVLAHAQAPLTTGFPALDALTGGIPRAAVTELLGAPTSGSATIALGILAEAQRAGARVAVLDLPGTFDPATAAACGMMLDQLLLARPPHARDAVDLLGALIGERGVDIVLVDDLALLQADSQGAVLLDRALRRLGPLLAASGAVVLARTPLPYPAALLAGIGARGSIFGQVAALSLHVDGTSWLLSDPSHPARQARVTLLHRRGATPGGQTEVTVTFATGRGAP